MSAPEASLTRYRCTEDKLFEAGLSVCIDGIKNFPVEQRSPRQVSVPLPNNNPTFHHPLPASPVTPSASASTPTVDSTEPDASLPSPPPSPSWSPSGTMHPNARGFGGGVNIGPPNAFSSQDARSNSSNLAIQPSATPVKVNLKKNAVKVVKPSTPTTKPEMTDHQKVMEGLKPTVLSHSPTTTPSPAPATVKKENIKDETFDSFRARMQKSPLPTTYPTPESQGSANTVIDKSAFVFDTPVKKDRKDAAPVKQMAPSIVTPSTSTAKPLPALKTPVSAQIGTEATSTSSTTGEIKTAAEEGNMEQRYLLKALDYLAALPSHETNPNEDNPIHLVKTVATKLRHIPTPTVPGINSSSTVNHIRSKYVDTVMTFVSGLSKNTAKTVDAKAIEQMLKEVDGNLLHLFAMLVQKDLLSIDSLDDVVGLCKALSQVVDDADDLNTNNKKEDNKGLDIKTKGKQSSFIDPMDNATAWPAQEKRENVVGSRTVILKGIKHPATINQIQALVWGGRVESIHPPTPGKDFAMVKFLTPEACQKYFDATENGIRAPDPQSNLVFVVRQPGPNSINDVLQNCIDMDATRCVRAVHADEDWRDEALRRLARGTSKIKREIDTIKRGKTAKGHYYIEFRFANLYNALNFTRELTNDEDWEACTISYATDPCESAQGVHVDN